LKDFICFFHEHLNEVNLVLNRIFLRLKFLKKALPNPREFIGIEEVIKSLDAAVREKLEEELSFSVDERSIPTYEISQVVQFRQEADYGLFDDVVKRIKEFMIYSLSLTWEVKLILVLLIQASRHQQLAHRASLGKIEVSLNMKIPAFLLLILQYFKVDLLQSFFDSFQNQIAHQSQYAISEVLISP
jgi:hypothetical protein